MESHIEHIETLNMGGGGIVDLVELVSGAVVAINSEVLILYPSRAAFDDPDTDASEFPSIELPT